MLITVGRLVGDPQFNIKLYPNIHYFVPTILRFSFIITNKNIKNKERLLDA